MVTIIHRSTPRSGAARSSSVTPLMMRSVIRDDSFLSLSPSNSTIDDGGGGGGTQTEGAAGAAEEKYETYHGGCAPIHFDAIRGGGNPCCAYGGHGIVIVKDMPRSPRSVSSRFFFGHRVGEGVVHVVESVSFDEDDVGDDSVDAILRDAVLKDEIFQVDIFEDRHLSRPNVHIVVGEGCNEFDAILDTQEGGECDSKSQSASDWSLKIEAETSSADLDGSIDPSFSVIASYSEQDGDDEASTPPPPPPPPPLPSGFGIQDARATPLQRRRDKRSPPLLHIPSFQRHVLFNNVVTFEAYEMDLVERKTAMFFSPEELRSMRADWEASVSAFMDLIRKKRMMIISGQQESDSPVEGQEDEDLGKYRGLEHWMSPMNWHRWKRRRAMVLGAVMEEQAEQMLHRQILESSGLEDQMPMEPDQEEIASDREPQQAEADDDVRASPENRRDRQSSFAYDFLLCSQAAAEIPVPSCSSQGGGKAQRKDNTTTQSSWHGPLLHSSGSISPNQEDARERLADASRVWSKRDRRTALKLAQEDRVWVRGEEVEACLLSMWSCGME